MYNIEALLTARHASSHLSTVSAPAISSPSNVRLSFFLVKLSKQAPKNNNSIDILEQYFIYQLLVFLLTETCLISPRWFRVSAIPNPEVFHVCSSTWFVITVFNNYQM